MIKNNIKFMSSGKKRILLVEDDKLIARAYKESLERAGFKVELATQGDKALESMRKRKPDLLLLDIIMPVMDGVEVMEEMSKDDFLKDIAIIVVTNAERESEIKRSSKYNIIDYFIKSDLSLDQLIQKITEHIT